MIKYEGLETFPSFRVERGEVKTQFDDEFGVIAIMHPYDVVQKLAEAGNFTQSLEALQGFIRKEIDIKADRAVSRLYTMHMDPEVLS